MMTRSEEFQTKLQRLRRAMGEHGLKTVLLRTRANFAWLSAGGRNFISQSSDQGVAGLLVDAENCHLICTNIDADRLLQEELEGLPITPAVFNWHEPADFEKNIRSFVRDRSLGSDFIIGAQSIQPIMLTLRQRLTEGEKQRLRTQGRLAASLLEDCARAACPGMTEEEVAGNIAALHGMNGLRTPVCLIGSDDRIQKYRNPLPTSRKIHKRLLMVAVAESGGLHTAASRMVSFEPLSQEWAKNQRSVTRIMAAAATATHAGTALNDVLNAICKACATEGAPDEWAHMHQGGPIAYQPREMAVTPATTQPVEEDHAYAWNPTFAGAKCEDTLLVGAKNIEQICPPGKDWPAIQWRCGEQMLSFADILVNEPA